jgi:predicted MFS family arabinose efflux permease
MMTQGGFFVGPFLGGLLLARWGYGALFYFCAVLSLFAAWLIHRLGGEH